MDWIACTRQRLLSRHVGQLQLNHMRKFGHYGQHSATSGLFGSCRCRLRVGLRLKVRQRELKLKADKVNYYTHRALEYLQRNRWTRLAGESFKRFMRMASIAFLGKDANRCPRWRGSTSGFPFTTKDTSIKTCRNCRFLRWAHAWQFPQPGVTQSLGKTLNQIGHA